MKFKKTTAYLILAIICSGCSDNLKSKNTGMPANNPIINSQLAEITRDFTLDGIPIHPLIIQEFISPQEDIGDPIIEINLTDAMQCNDLYGMDNVLSPIQRNNDEKYSYSLGQGYSYRDPYSYDFTGEISYQRLGVLKNGTQIIKTYRHMGGHGPSSHDHRLYLLKPSVKKILKLDYPNSFKPREFVALTLVGTYYGDIETEVKIKGNQVEIQPLILTEGHQLERELVHFGNPITLWAE